MKWSSIGLKERLQAEVTIEEVTTLTAEGLLKKQASNKTVKRWARIVAQKKKELAA